MHRTLLCGMLLAGLALAQDDKTFVMNAAIGGMAEVEMGKLVVQKASREDVKTFGQKMVDDHSKANDDLKAVAAKEKIDVPVSIDSKHQATIDRLAKLSGAAFDRAYIREMVKDHDQDVMEFKKESEHAQNAAIRDFAGKTLPTLQEHQRMIHDISAGKTTTSADRSKK